MDKPKTNEKLEKQFSEREHIQSILRKTRIIGLVLLIIEILMIVAAGYFYMQFHHPHFMTTYIPKFVDVILMAIAAVMAFPFFILLPYATTITIMVSLVLIACLGISIFQLRKWKALKLPDQDYRPAIRSIIYNALAIIPTIFIYVVLLMAILR